MSTVERLVECQLCNGSMFRYFDSKDEYVEEICGDDTCPNSLSEADLEILTELGYESVEEKGAALSDIKNYPTPYMDWNDIEEQVRWAEFCRALRDDDFTKGDTFGINGWGFEVIK